MQRASRVSGGRERPVAVKSSPRSRGRLAFLFVNQFDAKTQSLALRAGGFHESVYSIRPQFLHFMNISSRSSLNICEVTSV